MDNENICRTCLGTNIKMQSIFTNVIMSDNKISLIDILQNFYNYKIDPEDSISKNVCTNCVYQLTMTYSFKKMIEYSAETLANCIQKDIANYNGDDLDLDSVKDEMLIEITPIPSKKHLYCVKCKKIFYSVKTLQEHSREHPVENIVGRDCEYCKEKFSSFQTLIFHKKHHYFKYVCEKCWKCFEDCNKFNNHVCEKPSDNEKLKEVGPGLRQCDQCGKSYPRGYFKYHLMIHSEKLPYSCSLCPKKFKVRCSLNSHIKWRHERMKKYECSICKATFISASSRSTHIRKHHLKERNHACDSCNKRFFSKSCLERHLLTHTGVKNFHCHLCTKSYQTRYGLNVHLKTHNHGHVPDLCHWKN